MDTSSVEIECTFDGSQREFIATLAVGQPLLVKGEIYEVPKVKKRINEGEDVYIDGQSDEAFDIERESNPFIGGKTLVDADGYEIFEQYLKLSETSSKYISASLKFKNCEFGSPQ